MYLNRMDDFVNIISLKSYYIIAKDRIDYLISPLIYDDKFKLKVETTQDMAWISSPNLLPLFCQGVSLLPYINFG